MKRNKLITSLIFNSLTVVAVLTGIIMIFAVLHQSADGEQKVTVFERTDNSLNRAIAFTLKDVQKLEGNGVWLRYTFNNAKQ